MAPTPSPRFTTAAGVLNGVVHLVGGANLDGCSALTTNEAYDTAANTWTTRAPMTVGRNHPAAAVLNDGHKNLLYVVGGSTGCGTRTASMEASDPDTNTWTAKASMPAGARSNMGVGVINNLLYAVGGSSSDSVITNLVEVYDPLTDQWQPGADAARPVFHEHRRDRRDLCLGVCVSVSGGRV